MTDTPEELEPSTLAKSLNKWLNDPKKLEQQEWWRRYVHEEDRDHVVYWPPKEEQDPEKNLKESGILGIKWTGYHRWEIYLDRALTAIANDEYMRKRFLEAPHKTKEKALLILAAHLWGKENLRDF